MLTGQTVLHLCYLCDKRTATDECPYCSRVICQNCGEYESPECEVFACDPCLDERAS